MMKLDEYKKIIDILSQKHCGKQACLLQLQHVFPHIPSDTLHSIYSQQLQRKIKTNFKKHYRPEIMQSYYERCMAHFSTDEKTGIILDIAEDVDFPPVMIARIILEQHLKRTKYKKAEIVPKGQISLLLKDPKLIQEHKLEKEVELCLTEDEDCGPENDAVKRNIGEVYEKSLAVLLKEKDIPFISEEKLRTLGYDKTPDFKLETPIAVQGCVVNWIESKASFGDEESNNSYLQDQFWSYTNRFGPGMVIYWFDFIDELDDNRNREAIQLRHMATD